MIEDLTFPSGLIYIGILIVLVIIIAVQAVKTTNQKHELEYLRSRRQKGQKSEAAGNEVNKPQSVNSCDIFCNYKDVIIPAMQAEIDAWKADYRNAEIRCALMQDTITKLRTGKGEKPQRLAQAFNYDGQHPGTYLEIDNLFAMFRPEHETFFQYLLHTDFEFIIDAYNDFTYFDGDLDDIILQLSRELFYILFQNRDFFA